MEEGYLAALFQSLQGQDELDKQTNSMVTYNQAAASGKGFYTDADGVMVIIINHDSSDLAKMNTGTSSGTSLTGDYGSSTSVSPSGSATSNDQVVSNGGTTYVDDGVACVNPAANLSPETQQAIANSVLNRPLPSPSILDQGASMEGGAGTQGSPSASAIYPALNNINNDKAGAASAGVGFISSVGEVLGGALLIPDAPFIGIPVVGKGLYDGFNAYQSAATIVTGDPHASIAEATMGYAGSFINPIGGYIGAKLGAAVDFGLGLLNGSSEVKLAAKATDGTSIFVDGVQALSDGYDTVTNPLITQPIQINWSSQTPLIQNNYSPVFNELQTDWGTSGKPIPPASPIFQQMLQPPVVKLPSVGQ